MTSLRWCDVLWGTAPYSNHWAADDLNRKFKATYDVTSTAITYRLTLSSPTVSLSLFICSNLSPCFLDTIVSLLVFWKDLFRSFRCLSHSPVWYLQVHLWLSGLTTSTKETTENIKNTMILWTVQEGTVRKDETARWHMELTESEEFFCEERIYNSKWPCQSLGVRRRFGEMWCLHLQG